MKCCYAPDGALFLSEGTRISKLNSRSARRFYDEAEDSFGGNIDDEKIYNMATEAAEDIFTSCCLCVIDEFISSVEDGELEDAYRLLVNVYHDLGTNVPVSVRAAAALPDVWRSFCCYVTDELDVLIELSEVNEDEI